MSDYDDWKTGALDKERELADIYGMDEVEYEFTGSFKVFMTMPRHDEDATGETMEEFENRASDHLAKLVGTGGGLPELVIDEWTEQ